MVRCSAKPYFEISSKVLSGLVEIFKSGLIEIYG